ncbi:MAG: hypothetical protein PHQ42_00005, partial [Patescibacteria group bacterium]|nr:hypothetical protein [Patescibacteria group bacterium]
MQPNNLTKIKKLERQLTVGVILLFVSVIGFLAIYDLGPGQEALAITGNYNKNDTDNNSLNFNDWNNLPNDFVAKSGDTMVGNLILNNRLGLGANNPNSQIHIYSATGNNAEIDLQSVAGTNNHWGIYNE